jgi:hypothetical protein
VHQAKRSPIKRAIAEAKNYPNPKEAYVGYWLICETGAITDKFRPSACYQPGEVAEILKESVLALQKF